MKRLLIILVSFISAITILSAQETGNISGKISDENGDGVYSANVIIDVAKGWATATDFDGNYSIDVAPGEYTLVVRYIGYKDIEKTIVINANENLTVDLSLEPTEQVIGVVEIVSPTKRGIIAEKEVVTVETISSEILENNVITIGSEAVDKVAGVTLLDGQVSIRGGSGYAYGTGSRVILVIDEIPLLSPERNEILWDFVPMENVKSMDVVKGASSVQYGSSALNGIVSVNTKWPTSKQKETHITSFATLFNSPPIKEGKWWNYSSDFVEAPHELGVQFSHLRPLKDNMDLVVSGAMISNQSHIKTQSNKRIRNNIKFRVMPKKVDGLSLVLNSNLLYRNNDQFFIWENGTTGAYDGRSYQDRYVRWSFDPVVKYFFKDNNQLSFINRVYYDQRLNKGGNLEYNGTKFYNDFQYKKTYKNADKEIHGTSTIGVVNMHDIIRAKTFKAYSNNDKGIFHFNTFSTYTQNDFGWRDLTIAFGARFDFVSLDGTTKASRPIFNAGLSYELPRKNFLRFGFGQSFRIPSVAERFVKEEITSVNLGGNELQIFAGPNPDIKPETGYSFELGYKKVYKTPNFNATIDAAIFYQQFTDMTEFTFGNYFDPIDSSRYTGFRMSNVADARIFGWEATITGSNKVKKATLTYQLGYTYNYAADAESDSTLKKFFPVVKNAFKAFAISDKEHLAYTGNEPDNILHGIMRYRFRHTVKADFNVDINKLSFGTNVRYYGFIDRVDEVFALVIQDIQDYRDSKKFNGDWVVDLRASYQFSERFKLGFIVKNVFNRNYQLRPAKPDAPRTYTFQSTLSF